jgi:quercetin dioxygenase-like cupin family protein
MAHRTADLDSLAFAERPYRQQDPPRQAASLTEALGLENARATVWRYPAGARGRRHREGAQEEVFVVLEGRITLALGEPPEMVEVAAGGFASVATGTEIQVRNESEAEAVMLIWGAPAVTGQSEILDDLP